MGVDGDIKLGVNVETKSAYQSLLSFRKKMRSCFSGTDTKGLDKSIKSTSKTIENLEKNIEKIKSKLKDLSTSSSPPKSVITMEKELESLEKKLQKADAEFNKLSKEQSELAGYQVPGLTMEQSLTSEQFARFKELDNLIIENGKTTDILTEKINTLKAKLSEIEGNIALSDEGKKYSAELDEATAELEKQRTILKDLQAEQTKFNSSVGDSDIQFQGMQKNLKRIKELIKSALIFSVITKGFTAMRDALGNVISQNTALMSSLNQIKGNLLTAFAPIWQTIIPYLQMFLNVIAKVTAYVAAFVAMITGKSVSASEKAASALNKQAAAAKAAGGASKQAAKDNEKSALSFDELNTISSPKDDASSSGGGGASAPTFETTDVTISAELLEKLKAVLVLVGSIGGALAVWKLTEFISDLMESEEKLATLKNNARLIGGMLMIVAGAILLIKGYTDAWVNGIDWGNFILIIGGLALLIGGIALAISPVAAAFAAIGAGIALVVLGIKDFITNGPSFKNILTVIIGLATVFAAVWVLASAPIALIVTAIVALVAVFAILWNKCEGFRNFWISLWEKIKETTTDLWENTLKPLWEQHLKPAIEEIWKKIQELWEHVLKPIAEGLGKILMWLWDNILKPVIDWVIGFFVSQFKTAFSTISNAVETAVGIIGVIIDSAKTIFSGIVDFVVGVFTGDWKKAWEGVKKVFTGIINGIIGIFENMVNFVIRGINKLISGLDGLVNKAGSVIGLDIHIPQIPEVELPRLARGAVIPPNREFLAVLGDQKHGTNIEAPAELIKQMVNEALNERGYSGSRDITINFTGNLAQLARVLKPQLDKETTRKGAKLVIGGAY